MDTKEKIVEALDKNGISNVQDAIDYLEKINLEVAEMPEKWRVLSKDSVFETRFKDDKELIEWAREERDKIE